MNVSLSVTLVQSISGRGAVFQAVFPCVADHALPTCTEPLCRKWINLPSMSQHSLWRSTRKAVAQPRIDNRRENDPLFFMSLIYW